MSGNGSAVVAQQSRSQQGHLSSLGLLTWRAGLVTVRDTGQLIMFVLQPILFFAMFWIILGGSFEKAFGGSYRDFIAPGIASAAGVFGAQGGVGAGVALDRFDGFLGRLKPHGVPLFNAILARVAVDAARNFVGCMIILAFAIIVGLRPTSWTCLVIALLPLVGLGAAVAFPVAWVSLAASSRNAATSAQLLCLMPFGFISSAYVPIESLPQAFRGVATWNPVSVTADLVRSLFYGRPADVDSWLLSCGVTALGGIHGILFQLRRVNL